MDGNKPSALKVRQGLQEFMTQSREMSFGTEFSKEFFDVVNVDIELNNLDLAFNNYKIINLTDIHIGQWLNPEYLEGVVEYVNTLKPDMITLTGDYVSYILEGYEEDLKKSFKKLKAKDGKLAVLGNHDHWLGASEIRNILKKADVKDLSNDVYTLKKSEKNDNHEKLLNIAGVDSYTVGADNLDSVLKKLPNQGAAILLAHEPDFAKISSESGRFGLQISGHSHGGQFIIPGTNIAPFRGPKSTRYPVGKYKVKNIKLNVATLNNYLLKRAGFPFTYEEIKKSSKLIKRMGFNLIYKIYIGLPDATKLDEINTAKFICKLKPKKVEIYPVEIKEKTKIEKEVQNGEYEQLTIVQSVERAKEITYILTKKKIDVEIRDEEEKCKFKKKVESGIWLDTIVDKIKKYNVKVKEVEIEVNSQNYESAVGFENENIDKLKEYYDVDSRVVKKEEIKPGKIEIIIKKQFTDFLEE